MSSGIFLKFTSQIGYFPIIPIGVIVYIQELCLLILIFCFSQDSTQIQSVIVIE
jgi:hypothetical protein